MLKSFTAENFRGFELLEIGDLAKVNIFIGLNDAGKTSVLEGIHLLCSGPQAGGQAVITLGALRQAGLMAGNTTENPWASIFHNFDMTRPVRLSTVKNKEVYSVSLHEDLSGKMEVNTGLQAVNRLFEEPNSISITEHRTGKNDLTYRLSMSVRQTVVLGPQQNIQIDFIIDPPTKANYAKSAIIKGNVGIDLATEFSKYQRKPKGFDLLKALKEVDGRIESLQVLTNGPRSELHARINDELIPFPLLGDGLIAFAKYLLSMIAISGGSILIDEIGAGLHFSVLPKMWKSLYEAAKALDVQIIATTHSQETLVAANKSISPNHMDLAMFRLDRRLGGGQTSVTKYSGDRLTAAIEMNSELR